MVLDPFAVVLAAAFTAGCMLIHAAWKHADETTLVLAVLAIGLANGLGGALPIREGVASDPRLAVAIASYNPRHAW